MNGICKDFKFPPGTCFSKEHAWVRKNIYGLVKVGIDQFINVLLTDVSVSDIVEGNTYLRKGDIIFEPQSTMKKIKILLSINGTLKFVKSGITCKKIIDPKENYRITRLAADDFIEDNNKQISKSFLVKTGG